MKKTAALLSLFVALTFQAHAQIPNADFEQWWVVGNTEIPTDWFTYNLASAGNYYPVTKDTAHYPSIAGTNSIRLENNTALLPANEAKGLIVSTTQVAVLPNYQTPAFRVTGHPNSLTGYYKFAPQNNDSLWIAISLFQNGTIVSQGSWYSSAAASTWTSFTIPLSTYTTADSAEIMISAYNAAQPNNVPHGNSVLNIDNLNFDNLISGISEGAQTNELVVYPNPSSGQFTIQVPTADATITVTDLLGQQVLQTQTTQTSTSIAMEKAGVYLVYVTTREGVFVREVVVGK